MTTFESDRPVHVAPNENDPGRALVVHTHSGLRLPVRVPDLANADDLFKRCPPEVSIDLDDESGGESIRKMLSEAGHAGRDLVTATEAGELADVEGAGQDHFPVDRADWIMNPGMIAWHSLFLSQLEARARALRHLLNDRSSLSQDLSDDDRRALAQVARETANQLREEHRQELQGRHRAGRESRSKLEDQTRSRAREMTNSAPGKDDGLDPTLDDFSKVWG